MSDTPIAAATRRGLLTRIGLAAGGAAMYQAMTALGVSAASTYSGPIRLEGDPKGASVLILGAGVAGMVAAMELRKAGYRVRVLEYREKAGGRVWTLRGGDRYTELGGRRRRSASTRGSTSIQAPGAFPIITAGSWTMPTG